MLANLRPRPHPAPSVRSLTWDPYHRAQQKKALVQFPTSRSIAAGSRMQTVSPRPKRSNQEELGMQRMRKAKKPPTPAKSRKAQKPRSREAKKPKSQEAKKPRSQEAKKPRSQEAKKPRSQKRKEFQKKTIKNPKIDTPPNPISLSEGRQTWPSSRQDVMVKAQTANLLRFRPHIQS